jgi:hypothetical protein
MPFSFGIIQQKEEPMKHKKHVIVFRNKKREGEGRFLTSPSLFISLHVDQT